MGVAVGEGVEVGRGVDVGVVVAVGTGVGVELTVADGGAMAGSGVQTLLVTTLVR